VPKREAKGGYLIDAEGGERLKISPVAFWRKRDTKSQVSQIKSIGGLRTKRRLRGKRAREEEKNRILT